MGWLLRPLLGTWRAEIVAYCAAAGLVPREDATNADLAYARNRLRHEVIPRLEREQPGFARRLWESAAVFRDEDAWLAAELERHWPGLAVVAEDGVTLDLAAFAALPPALQRRAVRHAAEIVAGDLQGWAGVHIRAALALLGSQGQTGGQVDGPGGIQVRRERRHAIVRRAIPALADRRWPTLAPETVYPLPPQGTVHLAEWTLTITEINGSATGVDMLPLHDPWVAAFDAAALQAAGAGTLVLRTRLPGDRLRPLGAPGTRKLQTSWWTAASRAPCATRSPFWPPPPAQSSGCPAPVAAAPLSPRSPPRRRGSCYSRSSAMRSRE